MKNIFTFIKNKKTPIAIIALVVLVIGFIIFGGKNTEAELFVVKKSNVGQAVVLSGKVMTRERADLGFAASGRIGKIFVGNNEVVKEGQTLAQLEISDLIAERNIILSENKGKNVDLEAAKEDLDRVTAQQNAKVESAYRTLLTDGLVVTPSSSNYDQEVPEVTGIYDGAEGTYKIRIEQNGPSFNEFEVRTFELEKTVTKIDEEKPTALGTRGLYVSFPDTLSSYLNTTWYLDIPNKKSSAYLANYNAYQEAINAKNLAIKDAEFKYKKLLTQETGISSSDASLQKINAEIRKNTIYAPFEGIATGFDFETGESVATGERVVSVLGEGKLEVVLEVPELDVAKLIPDTVISVVFDAFPGETFEGILKTINSRETEVDGVPVYEAFVEIAPDARIKSGMSAYGTIQLESKKDVLVIPVYYVQKEGEVSSVTVKIDDKKTEIRTVETGLVGSDSMVEVISGLKEGETVVLVAE